MKLGVFDSGLGGLIIAKAIHAHMPDLDMVYLGDTLRLPYGNRSDDAIYNFTKRGIDFLFEQDCNLIVIACNTASAKALRRLQQGYLPKAYPGRNVIGVVVPTIEVAIERGYKKIGLIATNATVRSGVYSEELIKLSPGLEIKQQATPLLVPLIENAGDKWLDDILADYLEPLRDSQCILLGCTHYALLKRRVRDLLGSEVNVLSQDEIIPEKLEAYLNNHPEYTDKMSRNGSAEFYVSDLTDSYSASAASLYGRDIRIEKADL